MNDVERPLITFALFAFNQEAYIHEAVKAALAQTYSPLEIILSDDASSDDTAGIIRRLSAAYAGPHTVIVNVNDRNLGMGAHVNRVFRMARGEFIVVAAGDDISAPHRTARLIEHWQGAGKRPSAIYCGARIIDPSGVAVGRHRTKIHGHPRDTVHLVSYCNPKELLLLGACSAYSPDVIHEFGDISPDLSVEDIPLTVRASMLGGVEYLDEDLVDYRANVSVWLPRKLRGEPFERHECRLSHTTRSSYCVAKQILADVLKRGDAQDLRAAVARFIAYDHLMLAFSSKRFLPLRYLCIACATGYWRVTFLPSLLFGFPKLHRMVFRLKTLIERLLPGQRRG